MSKRRQARALVPWAHRKLALTKCVLKLFLEIRTCLSWWWCWFCFIFCNIPCATRARAEWLLAEICFTRLEIWKIRGWLVYIETVVDFLLVCAASVSLNIQGARFLYHLFLGKLVGTNVWFSRGAPHHFSLTHDIDMTFIVCIVISTISYLLISLGRVAPGTMVY